MIRIDHSFNVVVNFNCSRAVTYHGEQSLSVQMKTHEFYDRRCHDYCQPVKVESEDVRSVLRQPLLLPHRYLVTAPRALY